MSNAEEPAPVPKTENSELESFSDSSPEPDDPNFIHEEVTQVQKRKGGRKPVRPATLNERLTLNTICRYMPHRRKESKGTDRLRQHSESGGRNTSNS